jgi:hypothetical protein
MGLVCNLNLNLQQELKLIYNRKYIIRLRKGKTGERKYLRLIYNESHVTS